MQTIEQNMLLLPLLMCALCSVSFGSFTAMQVDYGWRCIQTNQLQPLVSIKTIQPTPYMSTCHHSCLSIHAIGITIVANQHRLQPVLGWLHPSLPACQV
jgi:hypothetical protein